MPLRSAGGAGRKNFCFSMSDFSSNVSATWSSRTRLGILGISLVWSLLSFAHLASRQRPVGDSVAFSISLRNDSLLAF